MSCVDPKWKQRYREKIVTAQQAVEHIAKGRRVFVGSGCAEPQLLVNALAARGDEMADTQIVHLLTLGTAPYVDPKLKRGFRHNAFFIGDNVRDAVAEGRADFTPIFLSELPALFRRGRVPVDTALIAVSPPDEHGYCSYGVAVDVIKAAAESARHVIAEVNVNMPRTLGDCFIHIRQIDKIVPSTEAILETAFGEPDEIASRIARNIVELIDDESTIQLGIGTVPDAVLSMLEHHKNLGIHTEMFSDGVIPLVEKGVINGACKTLHPGMIIASFVLGTRRLFDFIDDNPMCEFHPTEYTNDPFVIAQNRKMVSINSALQVDLTGQVCADSLGTYFYSGIGGQVDFVRGAARSEGGKPIIALPSTAGDGSVSRIVATLNPGAGVVTSRGDVHYVITEYGAADLHGKTIRERAMALIHIAHPKFRDELMEQARRCNYVYKDQVAVLQLGEPELDVMESRYRTPDGAELHFRPIHPTDEDMFRDMFYSFSPITVQHRFFHQIPAMPHEELKKLIAVDYLRDMILVGLAPHGDGEIMIAVGRYHIESTTGAAEVAFTMRDEYQHKGIGTYVFRRLIEIARARGVTTFVADVMIDNHAMINLFHRCALGAVQTVMEGNDYRLSFTIEAGSPPAVEEQFMTDPFQR